MVGKIQINKTDKSIYWGILIRNFNAFIGNNFKDRVSLPSGTSTISSEIKNTGPTCPNLCEQENDTIHQHATSQDKTGLYLFGSHVAYQIGMLPRVYTCFYGVDMDGMLKAGSSACITV